MHLTSLPPVLLALLLTCSTPVSAGVSTILVTQTVSAPAAPTSTSYTDSSDFQSTLLSAHNFYRTEHNATALTWNATSATYATSWAAKCGFQHSGGPTGENLAAGYANTTAVLDAWAGERSQYNFNKPGFSESTGHFTQVVWKATTSVGCGVKACNGQDGTQGEYVVCEYYPPGNVVSGNEFATNVQSQVKGKKDGTVEEGMNAARAIRATWGIMWFVAIFTTVVIC